MEKQNIIEAKTRLPCKAHENMQNMFFTFSIGPERPRNREFSPDYDWSHYTTVVTINQTISNRKISFL